MNKYEREVVKMCKDFICKNAIFKGTPREIDRKRLVNQQYPEGSVFISKESMENIDISSSLEKDHEALNNKQSIHAFPKFNNTLFE